MSFSDPLSLTYNAVATNHPRISSGNLSSKYATADGKYTVTMSHTTTKTRERHLARVDERIVATDPISAANFFADLSVYLVIDNPNSGYTDTEIDYVVQALKGFLTTANVLKILGQES
jgi:hypothetical protein